MDDPNELNNRSRKERRAARKQGHLDNAAFIKIADKFIGVANRENKRVLATELHMAFLYGAARYNAYVANAVLNVPDHEAFVEQMTKQYQEMLRQNLADPTLVASAASSGSTASGGSGHDDGADGSETDGADNSDGNNSDKT